MAAKTARSIIDNLSRTVSQPYLSLSQVSHAPRPRTVLSWLAIATVSCLSVTLFLAASPKEKSQHEQSQNAVTSPSKVSYAMLEDLQKEVLSLQRANSEISRQLKDSRHALANTGSEDAKKQTPSERGKGLDETTESRVFDILPSSSVWCYGSQSYNRYCKFRNLCFSPKTLSWFIARTNRSLLVGDVPPDRSSFLEDTTVEGNHFFSFHDVDPYSRAWRNVTVRYEEDLHFIIWRWEPGNIMHFLHDDVMPLYFLMKEMVGHTARLAAPGEEEEPFGIRHRILAWDVFGNRYPMTPYQYLTDRPIRFQEYLVRKPKMVTCFRDAVVGNNHQTPWYQYGVRGTRRSPQGPLDKKVNGNLVREFSDWMARKVGANPAQLDLTDADGNGDLVVIISRKGDRLILNEKELAERLSLETGLPAQFMRMEDHSYVEQIKLMRRAKVVVGMHGSLLIMGMFCRRGTVLVEMFPYGVPSKNYSPYKTMGNLPGLGLVYRAWENNHENNSIPHPERDWRHGGLGTATSKDLEEIKGRWIPHKGGTPISWLYRIYQDTLIELDEISTLVNELLAESKAKYGFEFNPRNRTGTPVVDGLAPGPVGDETAGGFIWDKGIVLPPLLPPETSECRQASSADDGSLVTLSWQPSSEGAKPARWEVYVVQMTTDATKAVDLNVPAKNAITHMIDGGQTNFQLDSRIKPGISVRFSVRARGATKNSRSDWSGWATCSIK